MRRIAEFVLRHRRLVGLTWVILIVAGVALTQKTNSRLVVDFSLPGQPGTQTANQIDKEFHAGGKTAPYVVTITLAAGQTVTQQSDAVGKAFATVAQQTPQTRLVDEANTGDKVFRTKDDRTAYAMLFYRFLHNPTAKLPTDSIRAALQAAAPAGSTVGVTGEDALAVGNSSGGNGVLTEVMLGAVGALAVLAFVFASFLAFLPLVVAAASILTTFILLLPLTYLTDVSFIVEFLVALIGLGVAIDYSLLLVNRWREERDHGRDNHDAVVVAMETAGHAVVFSGVTVAIGLLALVVLPVPFMRSIGMGGALIPLASVLTTLTLTPAILGGIGPRVDWPKIRHENKASRSWSAWARGVVKQRYVAAGVAVLALGALFAAFLGIKIGLASSNSLAKKGPAYAALQTLRQGGAPTGVLTPMEVLVNTGAASQVRDKVAAVGGVAAAVVSTGVGENTDGHSIVTVIPAKETVNSSTVDPVRHVKTAVDKLPGVIGVAGVGADQIDFLKAVYGNFPLMVFAFLYGLSMDYEVFILSRIREEYDRGGSTNGAVVTGIGRTGRLVTSAALILFLAFVALASGPGTDLKTFASALGFGILLDATIVRSLLVPALVSMFGRWNWYLPDWLAKVLRVQESHPHAEPAPVFAGGSG